MTSASSTQIILETLESLAVSGSIILLGVISLGVAYLVYKQGWKALHYVSYDPTVVDLGGGKAGVNWRGIKKVKKTKFSWKRFNKF